MFSAEDEEKEEGGEKKKNILHIVSEIQLKFCVFASGASIFRIVRLYLLRLK